MRALDAANRKMLWILIGVGLCLFLGSILFIVSRAQ